MLIFKFYTNFTSYNTVKSNEFGFNLRYYVIY